MAFILEISLNYEEDSPGQMHRRWPKGGSCATILLDLKTKRWEATERKQDVRALFGTFAGSVTGVGSWLQGGNVEPHLCDHNGGEFGHISQFGVDPRAKAEGWIFFKKNGKRYCTYFWRLIEPTEMEPDERMQEIVHLACTKHLEGAAKQEFGNLASPLTIASVVAVMMFFLAPVGLVINAIRVMIGLALGASAGYLDYEIYRSHISEIREVCNRPKGQTVRFSDLDRAAKHLAELWSKMLADFLMAKAGEGLAKAANGALAKLFSANTKADWEHAGRQGQSEPARKSGGQKGAEPPPRLPETVPAAALRASIRRLAIERLVADPKFQEVRAYVRKLESAAAELRQSHPERAKELQDMAKNMREFVYETIGHIQVVYLLGERFKTLRTIDRKSRISHLIKEYGLSETEADEVAALLHRLDGKDWDFGKWGSVHDLFLEGSKFDPRVAIGLGDPAPVLKKRMGTVVGKESSGVGGEVRPITAKEWLAGESGREKEWGAVMRATISNMLHRLFEHHNPSPDKPAVMIEWACDVMAALCQYRSYKKGQAPFEVKLNPEWYDLSNPDYRNLGRGLLSIAQVLAHQLYQADANFILRPQDGVKRSNPGLL